MQCDVDDYWMAITVVSKGSHVAVVEFGNGNLLASATHRSWCRSISQVVRLDFKAGFLSHFWQQGFSVAECDLECEFPAGATRGCQSQGRAVNGPFDMWALGLQRLQHTWELSAAWSCVCEAGRFRSTEHPVTERKGGVQTSAKTEKLAKFIKFSWV